MMKMHTGAWQGWWRLGLWVSDICLDLGLEEQCGYR